MAAAIGTNRGIATALTRNGYGVDKAALGAEAVAALVKELSVSPKVNPNVGYGNATPPVYPVYRMSEKRLYLPRVLGLARFGPPARDLLGAGAPAPGLAFAADQALRPAQLEAVAAFQRAAADPLKRGGLIVVGCGGGKTVMAIHAACSLKKRTLIVAHKAFLLEQWRERLAQYAPGASVGIIRQAAVDVAGRDVVLASLQSLAMREYDAPDPKTGRTPLDDFGLVIVDECHHVAAEVFSRALPKITAAVMLGLSATPDRKDGLSRVIEWFLGPPCFVGARRTDSTVEVRCLTFRMLPTESTEAGYGTEHMIGFGRVPRRNTARMVNDVAACAPRNAFLVDALLTAMAAEPERRALVLSERREHLKDLERRLRAAGRDDVGYYVGGMKQTALDAAAASSGVLLATYQMASEAMDVQGLTMLLLATPFGDVNQSVGRVRRRAGLAIVIDVLDEYGHFVGMAARRARWYRAEKFAIVHETQQN